MTDSDDRAFPQVQTELDIHNPTHSGETYSFGGLTKREYFAAMAMQGITGNSEFFKQINDKSDDLCSSLGSPSGPGVCSITGSMAVLLADALIEAINK